MSCNIGQADVRSFIFCTSMQCHENGRIETVDFSPTAGKTLMALGRLLTGAEVGSIFTTLCGPHFTVKANCEQDLSELVQIKVCIVMILILHFGQRD
jgi:sulfite exporter TauE/SafE